MDTTNNTTISECDLDAMRRTLDWARDYQTREPQIRLFPDPMPAEGTQEWLDLAERLASIAQSHNLGLRPWESPPIDIDASGFANSPEEIELCQRVRDLGISIFEPDPATAIANATHARSTQRRSPKPRGRRQVV
jgi:hypothetical protein